MSKWYEEYVEMGMSWSPEAKESVPIAQDSQMQTVPRGVSDAEGTETITTAGARVRAHPHAT